MKKAIKIWKQMQPMMEEVKKRSLDYIRAELEKADDNYISFVDEEGEPIGGDSLCVTYDGGHHPEYASNAFNMVKGVYLKYHEGRKQTLIMLDTEDDDEYYIGNIDWDEIYSVALFLYNIMAKIKYYCPECGHEFVQGEGNFNYDTALIDFECAECGWSGNEYQAKNDEE